MSSLLRSTPRESPGAPDGGRPEDLVTIAVTGHGGRLRGRWRSRWRRLRTWLAISVFVLLGGTAIAALHQPPASSYLNPAAVGATGTHALADVLAGLGRQVIATTSADDAERLATRGSTLVVTSPQDLSHADLTALGRVPASVVLIQPDPVALAAIAPPVGLVVSSQPVTATEPGCHWPAAELAGTADMGGESLIVPVAGTPAWQCYPAASGPTLVQVQVRGRSVTVLGAAVPLMNAHLASAGNAALAINLLQGHRIVWLGPAMPTAVAVARGPKSFASLVPLAAYLAAGQLAVAALLAAAWRARRLGPVVAEPLPVVVKAAETTEGHGRLYQARRARAQAADALRVAFRGRLERAAGLPSGADGDAVARWLAQRSAMPQARITELVYGPPPQADQDLVRLAGDLDQLEREAGST